MSWSCPFEQGPNRAKKRVSVSELLLSQMPPGYPLVARGCLLSFGGPGLFSGQIHRLSTFPPVTSPPASPVFSFLSLYGIPAFLLLDELGLEPGKVLGSMTDPSPPQDSGTLNVEVSEKCHFLLPAHISIFGRAAFSFVMQVAEQFQTYAWGGDTLGVFSECGSQIVLIKPPLEGNSFCKSLGEFSSLVGGHSAWVLGQGPNLGSLTPRLLCSRTHYRSPEVFKSYHLGISLVNRANHRDCRWELY